MAVEPGCLPVVKQQLQAATRILIVSHARPDGDAIGSLLGLGLALQAAGKEVHMLSPDGVPACFRRLEGSEHILQKAQGEYDYICVLDCSDLQRTGGVLEEYGQPDLNIDHHVTNLNFARHNLVDIEAVAVAEMLADFLPALGLPLTPAVGAALLTGLITDTLGFRTTNMTPKALRTAASLMELGCDLPALYRQALLKHSFEAMRLWGVGLSQVQRQGRMVWTALSLADRASVGYPGKDDADLVNVLVNIDGADIFVIFVEQPDGGVKVSWRSQPGFDVSQIALRFGGGGHPNASGATIQGDLQEVQNAVLLATQPLLQGLAEGVS